MTITLFTETGSVFVIFMGRHPLPSASPAPTAGIGGDVKENLNVSRKLSA